MQNYDASLFQLIKQFAPERAVLQTGLLIQSHVLHRNKVANKQPSYENLYWTSSIIEPLPLPGGDTLDLQDTIYPYDDTLSGTSDSYEGSYQYVLGTNLDALDYTLMDAETAVSSVYDTGGDMMVLEDDLGAANLDGSKYAYYTWFHTGSGDSDWVYGVSVGEDQWNPFQPVILDNTVSDQYTTSADRFNNQFTTTTLGLLQTAGANMGNVLKVYGLIDDISGPEQCVYSVTDYSGDLVILAAATYDSSIP